MKNSSKKNRNYLLPTLLALVLCVTTKIKAQEQTTNKINITVSIKEKPESNVIQLPAVNVPHVPINKRLKKNTYRNNTSTPLTPKKAYQTIDKNTSKINKATNIASYKPKKQTPKNVNPAIGKTTKQDVNNKKLIDSNKIALTKENARLKETKPTLENTGSISLQPVQNTLNYIWIGSILVILGLVLGLLFGKTAFFISAVGVIFILLGVFIF